MPKRTARTDGVDRAGAGEILQAFYAVTGVPCRLYNGEGQRLLQFGAEGERCALCRLLSEEAGRQTDCAAVHRHGAEEADRFGGRYIYFCELEMTYVSSPLMLGGQLVGSLVCGPILMMDADDYLAGAAFARGLSPETLARMREALQGFCRVEPGRINDYSRLLFAIAVYIGGTSQTLLRRREIMSQQQSVGDFVQHLKAAHAPDEYPIEKENGLIDAIRAGDRHSARRLLNELFGYILFSTGGNLSEIRARSLELLVVISRAAISGGAPPSPVLSLNREAMWTLQHIRTSEELALTLSDLTARYIGLAFETQGLRHSRALGRALDYINGHYMERLTLEEAAAAAGMSPNYFSSVFRRETGGTFRRYLNRIRIENSRSLLLDGEMTILQICSLCGFEDQSYFVKVFKKYTGVTPSRFREQYSRIRREQEYGLTEEAPARKKK